RQFAQALGPVAVVLAAGERKRLGQAVGSLYAALVADRLKVLAVLVPLDRFLQLPFERIVVELVGRRECAAVDLLQSRQRRAIGGGAALDGGGAQIGPAVIEPHVAVEARVFRRLDQASLPLGVEQITQGGCRRLRDGGRGRQRQMAEGQQGSQRQCGDGKAR